MFKSVVLAATACTLVHAQDSPSPENFRGIWEGSVQTSFAAANPAVPNSYECMPYGSISAKHRITIGQFNTTFGSWPQTTSTQGAAVWTFPAFPGKSFLFSAYSDNIAKLRTNPTTLECYWMKVTGSGDKRKLTVITLGGQGYSWTDQCGAAAYKAIKDVDTKPYCESTPGSRAPYKSTILGVYDYKGSNGESVQGSGSTSTVVNVGVTVLVSAMGAAVIARV